MGIEINEIIRIEFNGQVITGTYAELEELCLALEEFLYDDPSYNELSEKVTALEHENIGLRQSLEYYRGVSNGQA